MIVKMKQVTLLTDSKRQETALLNLRKLGVLHPRLIMRPGSKELHVIETELDKVDKALSLLDEKCTEFAAEEKDETAIVNQIIEVSQEKEKLASELEKLVETRHWFERWGAVSYASLRKLQQNGIIIRFYVAEKSAFENLPADQITYPVKENQKMVYFIHITESPEERLNFKKEPMPEVELSILESEIRRLKNEIAVKSALIKKLSCARDLLERFRKNLEKQLEFYRVLLNMGVERGVAYLQGFCPVDKIPQLKKMAEEEYLGYLIEEPDNPAEVPTVLRNPKWVRIIQPLFDFMGTLPGYAEQDISLGFLVFFSIFYAMLVGDAGYGLIILLGTMFFARKNKKAPREPFRLMYLLGFTTVLWGLFSGTWFGSEKIAQFPVLQFFIIDSIYSFSETNQGLMMQITFIIGAVHLSLARILSALKKINSPVALAELGWVAILWGIYFVANHLVLGKYLLISSTLFPMWYPISVCLLWGWPPLLLLPALTRWLSGPASIQF